MAHKKGHRSFIKPCRSLDWGKVMPLSSHKGEESLDITTVVQIAAAQKGLHNFVLLTGGEQPVRIAWTQSAILAAPLLLRKSLITFLSECTWCSVFCSRATARCGITWQRNCDEAFLLEMLIHVFWKIFWSLCDVWQQPRLGGSERVNERSGRGLQSPVFQEKHQHVEDMTFRVSL